ncbi:hypothetical protein ACWDZ8_34295 [Streptomyces sp. NPDC003233]
MLVGLALAVGLGLGLGTVLARAVLPLIVLTGEATRPVPGLLVQLPPGRVALLLCTVAVVPLTVTALPTLAARNRLGRCVSRGMSEVGEVSRPASRVVAPWVRTRLRVAPGAAGALALLVALAACLAGAFPRAVDRYEDAGLRHAFAQAGPDHTTVFVQARAPDPGLSTGQRATAVRPAALERQYRQILPTVRGPLTVDRAQSEYGVAGTVRIVLVATPLRRCPATASSS